MHVLRCSTFCYNFFCLRCFCCWIRSPIFEDKYLFISSTVSKFSAERTVRKGPYNLQQHLPLPAYCPMVPCFIIKHLLLAAIEYISYFTYNCHLTFIIYTCLCLLVLNSHYTKKVVLNQNQALLFVELTEFITSFLRGKANIKVHFYWIELISE